MSLDLSPTPLARSNHAAGKVYLALFEGAVLDTCSIFVNLHNMLLRFHLPWMFCFTTVVSTLMSKSANESLMQRRRRTLTFPAVNLKSPHPTHFTAFRNDY